MIDISMHPGRYVVVHSMSVACFSLKAFRGRVPHLPTPYLTHCSPLPESSSTRTYDDVPKSPYRSRSCSSLWGTRSGPIPSEPTQVHSWRSSDEQWSPSLIINGEGPANPPVQFVPDTEGRPTGIIPKGKATFEMGEISVVVQHLSVGLLLLA